MLIETNPVLLNTSDTLVFNFLNENNKNEKEFYFFLSKHHYSMNTIQSK